jgi:branched-chain amino acid transport system permease protein
VAGRLRGLRASWRNWRETNPQSRKIIIAAIVLVVITYPYWYEWPGVKFFTIDVFGLKLDIVIVIAVYVMLALGLNIVVGYAGLLDLGYVAFYAIGAYTVGWFASDLFTGRVDFRFITNAPHGIGGIHISFWLILPLAGVVAAIAGIIIGWPTLRLRGDYLAIVTLGFGEIIPDVFRNADSLAYPSGLKSSLPFIAFDHGNLTNGVRGVKQMDRPGFGEHLSSWTGGILPDRFSVIELNAFFFLIVVLVLITMFVNARLRDSKMGRAWIAVREDEVAASAMGVPLMRTKLWAYAIGAVFGGVAGAYYGAFIGSVFPTSFFFNISIIVLCMVIVGGMGNIYGVLLGAILLEYLNLKGLDKIGVRVNDVISGLGFSSTVDIPKYKYLIFGLLLVVTMLFRPEGLIPSARRKAEFEEGGEDHLLYEAQHQ